MKVFSKGKFFRETHNCELYCRNEVVRYWADNADGKPIVNNMCNGCFVTDDWTEDVYNPVEETGKILNTHFPKGFPEPEPQAVNCRCYVETGKPPKHPRYKVVIDCAADRIFARMYVDDRVVKVTSAKRNPADKFNWRIGAQTAFERLWEKKKPKKPAVREVKRRANPGEWVKIVNATNDSSNEYENGDVLQIVWYKGATLTKFAYYRNKGNKFLYDEEYVVLEGYKPET